MLITNLLPLLSRYSLGFDLSAGPDGTVTLIVIPRKAEKGTAKTEAGEIRPISITATAAEIDDELAKGEAGALGKLIGARKALGDQLAEQQAAADAAKADAAKAKAKPAAAPAKAPAAKAQPTPPKPAAEPAPGEPVSLWE